MAISYMAIRWLYIIYGSYMAVSILFSCVKKPTLQFQPLFYVSNFKTIYGAWKLKFHYGVKNC